MKVRTQPFLVLVVLFVAAGALAWAQIPGAQPANATNGGTIRGVVKSGNTPLPGVAITAANTLTGKKVITSTDAEGAYSLTVPSNGRYVVRADLSAFNVATKETLINASSPNAQIDLEMVLLSRAPKIEVQDPTRMAEGLPQIANPESAGRGARQLNVEESADIAENGSASSDTPLQGMPALASTQEATNDSVSVSGAMGQTQNFGQNIDDIRDRIEEMRARGELPQGGMILGGPGGGGPGGGPGVFMLAQGGPPGGLHSGRFNVNSIHGSVFYNLGNAALDAAPYSLSGPATKPDYSSNRFGATVGGPLKIPKLFDLSKSTFFFFNMFGTRATTPYTTFSQVPTLAERGCPENATDPNQCTGLPYQFSSPITDPTSSNPTTFPNNQIPAARINPVAASLLQYIPLPNAPGTKNFVYSTSGLSDSTNIAFRIMHSFGAIATGQRNPLRRRGRNSFNFGLNYTNGSSNLIRPFPSVAGTTNSQGFNANAGLTTSRNKWTNNFRATFNQSKSNTTNLYAGIEDIAGPLGIPGISTAPQDWGIPNISFSSGYQGINDIAPAANRNRTLQFSDFIIWNHKKHNVRFGGDFRSTWINFSRNPNPRGTFLFSDSGGTGNDFANFLLGLPAQATVQYAFNADTFHQNGWDLFVTDDWRVRHNLTLNLGLRYEYVSPFSEASNQIANLDVTPGFMLVNPVLPGRSGPNTGVVYPSSLIHPDRNNYAPRIGIAWKPFSKTVVRAGYGINYNLGQYRSIVQQLALNPGLPGSPFSFTQTVLPTTTSCPTTAPAGVTCVPALPGALAPAGQYLIVGFPPANTISNTYGVDPNYRLGYVQLWNLNIQREIGGGAVLNIGYTGSKGTALDMVRAPDPTVANVAPFLWETSQGFSIMHAGSVRIRKRLQHGIAVGGTYTFSKSIDNASSIGGGSTVVAQNDLDLSAERGLSSFDQRHRFTGDWTFDLPFGEGRKWLAAGGPLARMVGDWEWNGSFTIASGMPFTAHVQGNSAALARGANGSLRADYTGAPIALSDPTIAEWFNTAAFINQCTVGPDNVQICPLGTAGRNTIIGPGSLVFNMSMSKNIPIRDMMAFELRADATNIFNTPQYTSIDTVVNSRTFGQVVSVGNMRQIKISMRFRF
jgi:outer membrane receptor protein involved in Fe transport